MSDNLPKIPLSPEHWQKVLQALKLKGQQARLLELMIRGLADKEIAHTMRISPATQRTYVNRLFAKLSAPGRMHLALRVLAASHQVLRPDADKPLDPSGSG